MMKRLWVWTILSFAAVTSAAGANPWGSKCIQPIEVAQVINGTLASTDCSVSFDVPTNVYYTDVYAFNGTVGQRIAITMNSATVDAWLELHNVNDTSATALLTDDDGGGGTNAHIPSAGGYYTLPATGTYYIWATSASARETGAYTIQVNTAVNNQWPKDCVSEIQVGQTINGTLTADCVVKYAGDLNAYYSRIYSFNGRKGQQIAIEMNSTDVDAWLELHNVNDVSDSALEIDDDSGGGTNARIPDDGKYYTLPGTGTYYIWAGTSISSQTGTYTLTLTSAAVTTVVEFYHASLDHYFITADSAEAAAIDQGSAGPGWKRTGDSFRPGGSTAVCRFYGSLSPGPNSHFYTVDPLECAALRQIQAITPATQKRWNFESRDFFSTPSVKGTCTSGMVPVYRAYNDGFARGVDSNHRVTTSTAAIQSVVARGWRNEGVVMCAPG